MESVVVNVIEYQESEYSLIVNFSGIIDGTHYQTPNYSFQVLNYNTSDHQEILKRIASVGKSYIEQMAAKETFHQNDELINNLKNLNSSNNRFLVSDITLPRYLPINNGSVDNLEVVL